MLYNCSTMSCTMGKDDFLEVKTPEVPEEAHRCLLFDRIRNCGLQFHSSWRRLTNHASWDCPRLCPVDFLITPRNTGTELMLQCLRPWIGNESARCLFVMYGNLSYFTPKNVLRLANRGYTFSDNISFHRSSYLFWL